MLETQDLREFSISSWYEKFKHISLETIIIDLPDDLMKKIQYNEINEDSENELESLETENTEVGEEEGDITEFLEQFRNALNALGKTVFIKNNWHAPMDAKMFSFGNSLKTMNVDDVILYFTSSSVIQEDFANTKSVPFCLSLRKWISIHPAAEFRCIVVNDVLRGITPRDWPTYYAHFKEEGSQIIEDLTNFYEDNIKLRFSRKNFIFDVIFRYPDGLSLVDFGPLTSKINLYAFTWNEIQPLMSRIDPDDIAPVFRYLESDIGIMSKASAIKKFTRNQS